MYQDNYSRARCEKNRFKLFFFSTQLKIADLLNSLSVNCRVFMYTSG